MQALDYTTPPHTDCPQTTKPAGEQGKDGLEEGDISVGVGLLRPGQRAGNEV